MRTTVGILGGISILLVGSFALAEGAANANSATSTAAGNNAATVSQEVFGGVLTAFGPAVVWMGVAAIVLISLGYLVAAGSSGR